MAAGDKLLDKMRRNPLGWRIADVEAACRARAAVCTPPRNGSHYKIKHPDRPRILTIPAHRPIKPVYIKELVRFLDGLEGCGE